MGPDEQYGNEPKIVKIRFDTSEADRQLDALDERLDRMSFRMGGLSSDQPQAAAGGGQFAVAPVNPATSGSIDPGFYLAMIYATVERMANVLDNIQATLDTIDADLNQT